MKLYRANGLLDLRLIRRRKIVIVGAGSLGSEIVRLLVLPWKEIALIDPDVLKTENLERHLLDSTWVGKPKVEGVANWLLGRVPLVTHYAAKVEDSQEAFKKASLIVIATGGQEVPAWVDQWNTRGIPMVVAGVHAYGRGGKITVLPHPTKVCYACMQMTFGEESGEYTPGTYGVEAPRALEAVPALRHTVTMVASLCADAVLKVVQQSDVQPHVIRWANESSTIGVISKGGGSIARKLRGIAERQALLGALPNITIERRDGRLEVCARRIALEQPFDRHVACPFHAD